MREGRERKRRGRGAASNVHYDALVPQYNAPFLSSCHPKGISPSWHPHWCLGLVTFHMCVCGWERLSERGPVCVPWWSLYPFLSHVITLFTSLSLWKAQMWQHVSHIRDNWYTGRQKKKKWAREWDWAATPVLASVCSQLVCGNAGGREAQSARCHCWTCLGSVSSDWQSEAQSPAAHFVLSEGFTLGSNDFDFILNKKKEITFSIIKNIHRVDDVFVRLWLSWLTAVAVILLKLQHMFSTWIVIPLHSSIVCAV